jgi:hypothetical protein
MSRDQSYIMSEEYLKGGEIEGKAARIEVKGRLCTP